MIGSENWEEFVKSPLAVLMLSKTDCAACNEWTEELKTFLETDEAFKDVRFGKMLLNQRGLSGFKRISPWLATVDVLPFNVLYKDGEKAKEFAGSGMTRLVNRLNNLRGG
ncbi:MAG: hypothetical protein AAFV29_00640 [Myxococcota bacterium]